jgi:HAD superfamily hydrolase (TIGR01509 family)
MSGCLIFDCDGVLGDTEQHGHLPAFNQMWAELGVPWQWSVEAYGRMLGIGGGKERMARLLEAPDFQRVFQVPATQSDRADLLAIWHWKKSEIFRQRVAAGLIPPRPGVRRLAEEALDHGWRLAVASTSAPESVEAMLRHAVGPETAARFAFVLAGEVVPHKKPAPDIYVLAAERFGVPPMQCVVIEDSHIGLCAATAAGMKCVITVSAYTRDEDFSAADLVLSSLGDPDGEHAQILAARVVPPAAPYLRLADLAALTARPTSA